MTRTDIINQIIKSKGYKNYLEIGINKGENFKKIECPSKIGVDPDPRCKEATHILSSDDFFRNLPEDYKFDIIFIDGLHLDFQVDKDIENSLKHLAEGGTIVLHDCNPPSKEYAGQAPLLGPPAYGYWNGTVYLSLIKLRLYRKDLQLKTVDTDWGVGILTRGESKTLNVPPNEALNWDFFNANRREILNLISIDEFKSMYPY